MKDKLKIGLKGFVFGLANIIPGVSGGTIALTMGIYEDLISSISPADAFEILIIHICMPHTKPAVGQPTGSYGIF